MRKRKAGVCLEVTRRTSQCRKQVSVGESSLQSHKTWPSASMIPKTMHWIEGCTASLAPVPHQRASLVLLQTTAHTVAGLQRSGEASASPDPGSSRQTLRLPRRTSSLERVCMSVPPRETRHREEKKKLTCVRPRIVDIDALMHQAEPARLEHQLQALEDLAVVVRRLGLHQQTHGPRVLQTDVRAWKRGKPSQPAFFIAIFPKRKNKNIPPIPQNSFPVR